MSSQKIAPSGKATILFSLFIFLFILQQLVLLEDLATFGCTSLYLQRFDRSRAKGSSLHDKSMADIRIDWDQEAPCAFFFFELIA